MVRNRLKNNCSYQINKLLNSNFKQRIKTGKWNNLGRKSSRNFNIKNLEIIDKTYIYQVLICLMKKTNLRNIEKHCVMFI